MDMLKELLTKATAEGGLLRVRAVIALALTGSVSYLFIDGSNVPNELMEAWFAATAFYFGTRAAVGSNNK